jgi:hypothetical protein
VTTITIGILNFFLVPAVAIDKTLCESQLQAMIHPRMHAAPLQAIPCDVVSESATRRLFLCHGNTLKLERRKSHSPTLNRREQRSNNIRHASFRGFSNRRKLSDSRTAEFAIFLVSAVLAGTNHWSAHDPLIFPLGLPERIDHAEAGIMATLHAKNNRVPC